MVWASNSDSVYQIDLSWDPVYDSNFKSYEIQFDLATNGLTDQSPIINFFDDPILQDMRKNSFQLKTLIILKHGYSEFVQLIILII